MVSYYLSRHNYLAASKPTTPYTLYYAFTKVKGRKLIKPNQLSVQGTFYYWDPNNNNGITKKSGHYCYTIIIHRPDKSKGDFPALSSQL